MRLLLLALQLQQAAPPPALADSATRAHLDSVTYAFFAEWRGTWEKMQSGRPLLPRGYNPQDTIERKLYLHCHFAEVSQSDRRWDRVTQRLIKGSTPAHASCPTWMPPGAPAQEDERRNIDFGIPRAARGRIRQQRNDLRALLDSAAARYPNDLHLTGQRVRFALDAEDREGALAAAAACAGNEVQCALLHGYVLYRLGLVAAADSTFAAAAARMEPEDRCAWTDVGMLLEPAQRTAYRTLPCAERARFESRLWWLADPLWLERGNERRAEHVARKVQVSLASALGVDERQRYLPQKGGEALVETLVRYGWPTHVFWGGWQEDGGHDMWLIRAGADTGRPYVAREYSRGRLHVLPAPDRLADPLAEGAAGWTLLEPKNDGGWWPREHYARDASRLVPLVDGQLATFRRRAETRLAWATPLDAKQLGRAEGDEVRAALFASRETGAVDSVASFAARAGRSLVVDALLAPGRALLGVELGGDSVRAAARARFGVVVDPALGALSGGRALSRPLLFDPPADAARTLDADAAIARMFGSTTLDRARRIGVYWEGYGFTPSDTVDIEVRISREDKPGILERVAGVFRLGDARGSEVGMRWREAPGSSRALHLDEGVPVQMRSVVLEISRLQRGTYRLQVLMSRAGGAPVMGERMFALK